MMTTKSIIDTVKDKQNIEYVEELYDKVRLGDETAFKTAVSLHRLAFDNMRKKLTEQYPTLNSTDIDQCCYIGLYEAILKGRKGANYSGSFRAKAMRKAELLYLDEKEYNERFDNHDLLWKETYEIDKIAVRNERNEVLYDIIRDRLTPAQQFAVIRYYGLDGYKEWTSAQISEKLGYRAVNTAWGNIQRIEKKIYFCLINSSKSRTLLRPDFHIRDLWDATKHQDISRYQDAYADLAGKAYHTLSNGGTISHKEKAYEKETDCNDCL